MARPGRPTPAYRELADRLRIDILANTYAEGRRLPTEAELTSEHCLSRQTVRRAYQELVAEGIVRRIPGRGTFPAPPGQYLPAFGGHGADAHPFPGRRARGHRPLAAGR